MQETHREVDEQQTAPAETPERAAHRPDYGTLHETQHQVDEQAPEERQAALNPQRSWTHHGGMEPQQYSAHTWHKQNIEIKMTQNENSGAAREGQGSQPSQPGHDENDPELQEARAAVEEARRREAAQRAQQQEHGRSGPER